MSKIKGPKDGVLTLSLNSPTKMPGNKKALMLLSIKNNELCEDKCLQLAIKQTTDKARKDNDIELLTILIADEIYWHNLAKSAEDSVKNSAQLKAEALRLGEVFFKTNLFAFLSPFDEKTRANLASACENTTVDEQILIINQSAAKLPIPFEIMRWATWVDQKTHKGLLFKDIQKNLEDLYQREEILIKGVDITAKAFTKRHAKDADSELLLHCSKGYLIEESPAVMWLGAELGYNLVIYPGGIIPSFTATKDFFVVDVKNQELTKRPFAIVVENPKRYVNWVEARFCYKKVSPPKVAEKPSPVEALPITSANPSEKITPEIAKAVLTPLTAPNVYRFGMFPPPNSPRERRKSRPHSMPAISDGDKNVIKPTKKTTSLEEHLNPILLKAIMSIAQTLVDLPSEIDRTAVTDMMASGVFAELLCALRNKKPQREVATTLRMN